MKFLLNIFSMFLVLMNMFTRPLYPYTKLHSTSLYRQSKRSHIFSLIFCRKELFSNLAVIFLGILFSISCYAGQDSYSLIYVGSEVCKPCHEKEYSSYVQYAKKSKSYQSIERLEKGLSTEDLQECYSCHTTGYGRPGGFISIEETPELKNAGCEVCHGPGDKHAKKGDLEAITRKPTMKICETCHTSERVKAFRYKPLIHGGGH